MKRTTLLILLLLLPLALANDAASHSSLERRINTLEAKGSVTDTRLNRLEADVVGLARIPVQLGRIETRLDALAEQSDGWADALTTVTIALVTTVLGSVTGAAWQRQRSHK